VLNSPLEPVITAMKETNTVTVVVARTQSPESPKSEVSTHSMPLSNYFRFHCLHLMYSCDAFLLKCNDSKLSFPLSKYVVNLQNLKI